MLAILSVIDTIPIGFLISLFSQFLEKPATCDFGGCHGGGMSNRSRACGTAGIGGGTHRYNCGQGGGTPECNSVSMASAVPEALISEVAPGPDWGQNQMPCQRGQRRRWWWCEHVRRQRHLPHSRALHGCCRNPCYIRWLCIAKR